MLQLFSCWCWVLDVLLVRTPIHEQLEDNSGGLSQLVYGVSDSSCISLSTQIASYLDLSGVEVEDFLSFDYNYTDHCVFDNEVIVLTAHYDF